MVSNSRTGDPLTPTSCFCSEPWHLSPNRRPVIVQCRCNLRPNFPELDVCYLISPARGTSTYVGWTRKEPWFRCEQHNGVHAGGTARLAAKRPWHVVAFVFGFRACGGVSVQHCARRFESAWQLGWWCPSLSWHPRYQTPCHGVKAKLEVLKALLTSPSWVAHQLEVRIVRSSHGGMRDAHARRRENKYRAHLHPYPVTTVDHL